MAYHGHRVIWTIYTLIDKIIRETLKDATKALEF